MLGQFNFVAAKKRLTSLQCFIPMNAAIKPDLFLTGSPILVILQKPEFGSLIVVLFLCFVLFFRTFNQHLIKSASCAAYS